MTAITIKEVSSKDIVMSTESGVGKRRKKFYVVATSTTDLNSLNLTAIDPDVNHIEGYCASSILVGAATAVNATAHTWTAGNYFIFTSKGRQSVVIIAEMK